MPIAAKRLLPAAVLLGLSATTAGAQNLVSNGDFAGGLSSWSVMQFVYALTDTDYQKNAGGYGSSGVDHFAAFGAGNNPGGSLAQTLATTVGQLYKLTFSYAGFGSGTPQALDWSIGSLTGNASVDAANLTNNLAGIFQTVSMLFTAQSTSTLLSFLDTSPGSNSADMLLANVSVTAVPGPVAAAGLPGALALLGYMAWRRRART